MQTAASAFDPYVIFVNVGYGIMLLGFVLRDVLKLRTALIIGQAFVVTYNFHRGVMPSAIWNGLYMVINTVWVSRIIQERRPASIPAEIRDLYEKMYRALTPKEFLAFWKSGQLRTWGGDFVIREGSTPEEVYFVVEGTAVVERDGRKLSTLGRGRFFAEMSFLTGQPASAAIRGDGSLKTIAWSQRALRELEKTKPQLFMKLQGVIGGDLAQKLRDANASGVPHAA